MGLPLSFTQLVQSALKSAEAREQLVFHNIAIQEVEAAEMEYIKSLPWFALNLVPIPTIVFLRHCANAEKAAIAANDLAKAKSMRSYRLGVTSGLVVMGTGISTSQIPVGYDLFKSYYKKLKEKEEKLKAGKP